METAIILDSQNDTYDDEIYIYDLLGEDDDGLKILPDDQRVALITVAILLCVISFVGNLAALIVVCCRKQRMLYKCCLVSLSSSDLILGIVNSLNYITKFFQKYSNSWALVPALCSLLPMLQTMCLIINSMTLSCIALDRYKAVSGGGMNRWNPTVWISTVIMLSIWTVSAGIAVPMYDLYDATGPYYIINANGDILPEFYYFCALHSKDFRSHYLTTVFTCIFLPLFASFVGFYIVVAKYVWKQRLPISTTPQPSRQTTTDDTMTLSPNKNNAHTNIYKKSNKKSSPRYIFKTKHNSNLGSRSTLQTDSRTASPLNQRKENDSATTVTSSNSNAEQNKVTAHTKRKVRTFKIILVLIFTCFICRMPNWAFLVIQAYPNVRLRAIEWWLLQFWLALLSQSSTALNPFLYCFLNETLEFFQTVRVWLRNMYGTICSCRMPQTNFQCEERVPERRLHPIQPSNMIPRGPYSHKDNRVEPVVIHVEVNHM